MTHRLPTSYVLHPLFEVFLETVGVVIPPGVAGPEVESAVVGVVASGVAGPGVVAVSVAGVAAVSGVAEPAVDVVAVVVV